MILWRVYDCSVAISSELDMAVAAWNQSRRSLHGGPHKSWNTGISSWREHEARETFLKTIEEINNSLWVGVSSGTALGESSGVGWESLAVRLPVRCAGLPSSVDACSHAPINSRK